MIWTRRAKPESTLIGFFEVISLEPGAFISGKTPDGDRVCVKVRSCAWFVRPALAISMFFRAGKLAQWTVRLGVEVVKGEVYPALVNVQEEIS